MKPATPEPLTTPGSNLLDKVEPRHRGILGNVYHTASRRQKNVDAVLEAVSFALKRKICHAMNEAEADTYRAWLNLTDTPEAREFAAHCLAHQALPPDERAALKEARNHRYRQEWQEQHPPSDRQIGYLRNLGDFGPEPITSQEAHERIETALAAKGGRR